MSHTAWPSPASTPTSSGSCDASQDEYDQKAKGLPPQIDGRVLQGVAAFQPEESAGLRAPPDNASDQC
jgi:hypothetical protein